jgi:hypothetical protein
MRRAAAWLVALPLMLSATAAAHALDYRLVVPDAGARATLLAATGHNSSDWLPLVLAAGAATALVALAGSRGTTPRVGPFIALPSLTFVLQEHLERLMHDGAFPWHLAGDPTFAPGLALTIPFGFAAYFAARAVLDAAQAIGIALEPRRFAYLTATQLPTPVGAVAVRVPVLASLHATRGPPAVR